MARKPRLHYVGALYHVMVRGNDGKNIFANEEDRYRFYLFLQEGVEKFGHRIHAFCLMDNHVHLAIQVGDKPLSRIMQNLCFRYTQWINSKQKKVGHLFQGRYKAIVVDAESYLAELVRYIHLNPVRAKIIKAPEDYRWSGHRAYMRQETLPWLTTEWVLSLFSQRLNTARGKYAEFINEGKQDGHRQEFHKGTEGRILGDDTFIDKVLRNIEQREKKSATIDAIITEVGNLYGLTEKEIVSGGKQRYPSEARGLIAYIVREINGLSLADLGKRMKRDASSLSHAVERMVSRSKREDSLGKRKKHVEKEFL
ncbi:MAG TPA: transposase [Deltaproteobacteria bacterium]|nr:transposase [Deltaproteobacteria bacterium]